MSPHCGVEGEANPHDLDPCRSGRPELDRLRILLDPLFVAEGVTSAVEAAASDTCCHRPAVHRQSILVWRKQQGRRPEDVEPSWEVAIEDTGTERRYRLERRCPYPSRHDSPFNPEEVLEWEAINPRPSMAAQFRQPLPAGGELNALHPCQVMIPVSRPSLGVFSLHLLADVGYVDVSQASTLEDTHRLRDRPTLHELDGIAYRLRLIPRRAIHGTASLDVSFPVSE